MRKLFHFHILHCHIESKLSPDKRHIFITISEVSSNQSGCRQLFLTSETHLTIALRFYTGLVGFHQANSSLYCSMQNTHSNNPSTISNRFPRVDIKPQFLQMYIFGGVSFMLLSEVGLYSTPCWKGLTVMSNGGQ